MSSRKNTVRQHTINRGHILFFFLALLLLCLGGIGGINYGLFQKQQRASSEEKLLASTKKQIEQLTQEKRQAESKLADVNEEMEEIHQMAEQIQEALGILGQGGGDSAWVPDGSEGSADTQQANVSAPGDTSEDTHEKQESLTPSPLKHEIQRLHNHISEHQKQLDGYPSILPVKLEQEGGEKHVHWYSSQFGWRIHPLTKKREFHQGLDIKTQSGVPVIATANGSIVKIEKNGYLGKTIEITHEGDTFKTLYAHLQDYAEGLKVREEVTRGQIIGYVGNTGRSTGAHLHYGVYDIQKEQWVNPITYILDQKPVFSP
jgi:murein DD-endopeptidase MepM/ murein hydrolase activator NlpD